MPSHVSVFSLHFAHEPFYLFKITNKHVAEKDKEDIYGHLEGFYLEKVDEKTTENCIPCVHPHRSKQYMLTLIQNMAMSRKEYICLLSSY